MNQGKKTNTQQMKQKIGEVAEGYVNVNKRDANLHIVIPLVKTLGPNPMEIELIYNEQDKEELGHFGKGVQISTYKNITDQESYISVKEADGSYTRYNKKEDGIYQSEENTITLHKQIIEKEGESEEKHYEFKDRQGNKVVYSKGNTYYPTSIEYVNEEKITFSGMDMDNGHSGKLSFKEESGVVKEIEYHQNQTLLYKVELGYDSNKRIHSVKHRKEGVLVKEVSIIYEPSKIKVEDKRQRYQVSYQLNGAKVTKIEGRYEGEANHEELTIQYKESYTIVIDKSGNEIAYGFDGNQLPSYEVDTSGNMRLYRYDNKTKLKVWETETFNLYETESEYESKLLEKMRAIENLEKVKEDFEQSDIFRIFNPESYVIYNEGYLEYELNKTVEAGEEVTLIVWGKVEENTELSLSLKVGGQEQHDYFKMGYEEIEPILLHIPVEKEATKIEVGFWLENGAGIIGGAKLIQKDILISYSYDKNRNLVSVRQGGKETRYSYDEQGSPIDCKGIYGLEYNPYRQVSRSKTGYGCVLENEYNIDKTIKKKRMINASETKGYEREYTYKKSYLTETEKDELGNVTSYEYDAYDRLTKIIDALGQTKEYTYNAYDQVKSILQQKNINFTYDEQGNLTTLLLENGESYSFTYDNHTNITTIKYNGIELVAYTYAYKQGWVVATQRYEGNTYQYSYDELGRLKEIKRNGIMITGYTYDKVGRLSEVKNPTGILRSYSYDSKGNVKQIQEGTTLYSYRNDGCKRKVEGFENLEVSTGPRGLSPDSLIQYFKEETRIIGTIYNRDATLQNQKGHIYATSPLALSYGRKGGIPYLKAGGNSLTSYTLKDKFHFGFEGSIGFWFYPESNPTVVSYLFSMTHPTLSYFLGVRIKPDGQLEIVLKNNLNQTVYLNNTNPEGIKLKEWNFVAISFEFRQDDLQPQEFKYILCLNDKVWEGQGAYDVRLDSTTIYHIGYRYEGKKIYDELGCPITALIIGSEGKLSLEELKKYYARTKEYILAASQDSKDAIYHSSSHTLVTSEGVLKGFEVIPLEVGYTSLSGHEPIHRTKRKEEEDFIYSPYKGGYGFYARKEPLLYSTSLSSTGTIIGEAIFLENKEKSYLFELSDGKDTIGVYRDKEGYLSIENNTNGYKTTLNCRLKTMYMIGLSFSHSSVSDSLATIQYRTIRIYVNGQTYTKELTGQNSTGKLTLKLGREMMGILSLVGIRGAYCEISTLNQVSKEMKGVSQTTDYNEFGIPLDKSIKVEGALILNHSYTYKTQGSSLKSSREIEKEAIFCKTNSNRSYTYDKLGRITSITDSTFGSHSYTYNTMGYLTKEDTTTYTYDSMGNLLTRGAKRYSYDRWNRLINVDGKSIAYEENSFNPKSYNGIKYTYEGRRLTRLQHSSGYYSFEYNAEGLRTSKKDNRGIGSRYYYEGDRLITEMGVGYRLDFLYDESGLLYGFIKDKADMYFYIKDILQNILGIVDSNGNVVVKYSYTAYGEIQEISGAFASTIGAYNPFRYKGYYYDTETGLYLVTSRYYNPEWCRFISPDSIEYLDPSSINGLNLYAYCSNNPIGITYSGFSVGRSASGRMASSIVRNLVNNSTIKGGFGKANRIKTNSVLMTNKVIFSLIKDPTMAKALGNITYGVTIQHNSPETFYSFSNVGKDGSSVGFGTNFGNWYGYSVYLTSDIGFGSSWQLTPWLTGSSGWSLENGISFSGGFINGNTTHEVTISVGNGVLAGYAACALVAAIPAPGARVVAGIAAGIIFIVDLFK